MGHAFTPVRLTKETAFQMAVVLYTVYAEAASKETSWDPSQTMDGAIDYSTPEAGAIQLRFSSSCYPTGNFQVVMRVLSMSPESAIEPIRWGTNQIRCAHLKPWLRAPMEWYCFADLQIQEINIGARVDAYRF